MPKLLFGHSSCEGYPEDNSPGHRGTWDTDIYKLKRFAARGWGVPLDQVTVRHTAAGDGDIYQIYTVVDNSPEVYRVRILDGKVMPEHEAAEFGWQNYG